MLKIIFKNILEINKKLDIIKERISEFEYRLIDCFQVEILRGIEFLKKEENF